MPCACSAPFPDFPTTCSWGPILWKILHGLANHYGQLTSPMYIKDQEITWPRLLEQTAKILPCKDCREHYTKYLATRPSTTLQGMTPTEAGPWIKHFFFDLHNDINRWSQKPEAMIDILDTPLYTAVNFNYELKHFEALLKIVFQYNEVTYLAWLHWVRSIRMLLSIYGL